MDDRELLTAWNTGDSEAGDQLVQRHFLVVHHFFAGRVDDATVDDLTHQTFLACLQHGDGFRGDGTFRAYLLGIARNKLLMHLRDRRTARNSVDASVDPTGPRTTPSTALRRKVDRNLVVRALRTLAVDDQLVIELHYWDELSMPEVATVLGVPLGTVKSRVRRARARLERALAGVAGDGYAVDTEQPPWVDHDPP